MTHLHQIILQQRHLDLKSSLNVEDHILDYMYEKEFISKDLKCKIAEKSSQKDQVRILPHVLFLHMHSYHSNSAGLCDRTVLLVYGLQVDAWWWCCCLPCCLMRLG